MKIKTGLFCSSLISREVGGGASLPRTPRCFPSARLADGGYEGFDAAGGP